MCYPALIGLIGAGVSAYGSMQTSRANAEASLYNAQISQRNAQATIDEEARVRDAAAIERRRLGEDVRAKRGELIASYTAMGVDPAFGTPADLIGDTEQAYRIDRSILSRNEEAAVARLDKERADHLSAAAMGRTAATSSMTAGSYAAAGTLLDGVSTVSSRWIQPRTQNPTMPSGVVSGVGGVAGSGLRIGG